MYNLLSLLIGALIAIMVSFNGMLSGTFGLYASLVIIHLVGLVAMIIILMYKKKKIQFKTTLPWYLYSAGVISIFTVMFNNLSYPVLGVSLPLALGLLGQTITSIIIDHYGFLGMKKIRFNSKKIVGLLIIVSGVCIMTFF